jgi:hypothetical protein
MVLLETLRFFGITSLIIVLIHAQVAAGYPKNMMLRAFVGTLLAPRIVLLHLDLTLLCPVQAVYYFVFAASLWLLLPNQNWVVQVHVGTVLVAAGAFGIISFTAPMSRSRQTKTSMTNK